MASLLVRLMLLVLGCASACPVVGQASIIRRLKSELTNDDLSLRERGHKLERLSWHQRGGDPVSAGEAAQEAIAIAERINDPSLLGSAIVRMVAAKQTEGDRTGDAVELHRALALLHEYGPEMDMGYAYWCLFMDLSEVSGQDSLRAAYNREARALFDRHKEETGRYWVLLLDLYSETLIPRDVRSAEKEIEQLMLLTKDTCLKASHYSFLHIRELAMEDFLEAERIAKEHLAMSLAGELPFEEYSALYELAQVAYHLGDHESALQFAFRMLGAAERLRWVRGIRASHNEIAARFVDLNDNTSAMQHFKRALSVGDGPQDDWERSVILRDLGECCLKNGQIDSALLVLHQALGLFSGQASGVFASYEASTRAFILQLLGTAYRMKGDMQRSRMYLDHGLKLADHPDLRMDAARIRIEHARTLAFGSPVDRKLAIAEVDSVIALTTREGWLELTRDARLALYEVHDRDGNAAAALQNLRLYIAVKDSLIDLERIKNINALNKRFESDRKDAELKTLSATNTKQGHEIIAHRRRNIMLLVGIAAMMLIGGLLFTLLRNTRQSRKLLAEKNATILEAQAKLVVSEREREASEVRTRIARDVHDQLGSDLTKLVMLSTEAKEVTLNGSTDISALAGDIERIAGEANRSLGDIVWAIDPHLDSLAGLTDRVRAHCERMLKWSKVAHTIDCVHDGPDRSLDPATKRDIYLMLRESLNNTIKYAKAERIDVRFHSSSERVEFEVQDDGVGMDAGNTNGHGLENMRHRAERVGGTLDIRSSETTGTCVSFRVELAER